MEKTIVFLPMIVFGVIFLLLIVGFIGLIGKLLHKAKNDEWSGTVVDKLYNTKRDDSHRLEEYFCLVIKTKAGDKRNIAVSSQTYNNTKVGDHFVKTKGTFLPEKTDECQIK